MEKLSAKVITELVVWNMVSGFEEFKYSTLAPSQFRVFLHPKDFDYFRPVFERLNNETRRALSEELDRRNNSWLKRTPRYEVEGGDWNIQYFDDPDRVKEPGFVEVESELAPPERESLEGGRDTIRVTTRGNAASKTTVRERVHQPAGLATITYDDDGGRHVYAIHKEKTFIGRSKDDPQIDIKLQLNNDKDVSRQHACIRLDPVNHSFYIKDFSTYGTTVNGQPIPKSMEETAAESADKGIEFPLPRKARIGLAGRIFLEFQEGNAP
jgi:pSer/pThr/pTyr-binding forkhead associated (FHA) protein